VSDETELEHRLTKIEECLKEVCENHLPHIREEIADLKKWILGMIAALVVGIVGMLLK
jgi:hypothetical protein